MPPQVTFFGYPESPYAGKIVCALTLFEIPYKQVRVGRVLPRPALELFGITYRRIPILAIGKDFFCDTKAILAALIEHFPDKVQGKLGDAALNTPLEMLGTSIFRQAVLTIYPTPPEAFVKDRKDVFPIIASPKFARLRPHAVGEVCALFAYIQDELLKGRNFISGDNVSLNDIHVAFMAGWAIQWLNSTNISAKDYPGVYAYVERFHKALDWPKAFKKAPEISPDDAFAAITSAQFVLQPSVTEEMLGYKAGDDVQAYPTDAPPNPQFGKLVGLNNRAVTLEVESTGVHVTFPRLGTRILRKGEEKL